MSAIGQFDTDTAALKKRLHAHEQFAALDLNQWCFELLSVSPGMRVLELGCGTGKQSLPLARLIGEDGRLTAVDISSDALETLTADALAAGLGGRIAIRRTDLDEVPLTVEPGPYDRVLACYSLYYAKRPEPLLEFLHQALRSNGILFFCGPAEANNAELKQFHESLYAEIGLPVPARKNASPFMEGAGPETTRRIFGNAEVLTFENPLRFASADALYSYWSSYNLYDTALDKIFRVRAQEHFARADCFETVKRVIGVRAVKAA